MRTCYKKNVAAGVARCGKTKCSDCSHMDGHFGVQRQPNPGQCLSLNDLADVTITNPQSGQCLCYTGAQWINVGGTGDSGGDDIILGRANYYALSGYTGGYTGDYDNPGNLPFSDGTVDKGVRFPRIAYTNGVFSQPTVRRDSVLLPNIGVYSVEYNLITDKNVGVFAVERSTDGGTSWTFVESSVTASKIITPGLATSTNYSCKSFITTTVEDELVRVAQINEDTSTQTLFTDVLQIVYAISANFIIEQLE